MDRLSRPAADWRDSGGGSVGAETGAWASTCTPDHERQAGSWAWLPWDEETRQGYTDGSRRDMDVWPRKLHICREERFESIVISSRDPPHEFECPFAVSHTVMHPLSICGIWRVHASW